MFWLFYQFFLYLLALIWLPKMAYMRFAKGKYSHSFLQRWGFNFPKIDRANRYLIWVHAVSLGETKVAATLVKKIREELKDPLIIVSSVTETGHQEALKSIPQADYKVYLPFDFPHIMHRILSNVRPNLVILCESDLWYNFLTSAKKFGASIIVANGKISERSQKRFSWFPVISRQYFNPVDFFCVQNKHYYERFISLGVLPSKLAITGNIKFDDAPHKLEDPLAFRQKLGFAANDLILVAGSTHDPEEKIILTLAKKLWNKFPTLKIILVPRHPERFIKVEEYIQKEGISYQKYSSMDSKKEKQILIIDTMGVLKQCYQIADIALVGGSFTPKVGGHNILEPSWYGIPVLFGPYMNQQPEMVELIKDYRAGKQVDEGSLENELADLLISSEKRDFFGKNGLAMMHEIQGATEKTWVSLVPKLNAN